MTTTENRGRSISVSAGVYEPQDDSWFLAECAVESGVLQGASVLDMCTGSGVLAIEAARADAGRVVAIDLSSRAVACALRNAAAHEVVIDARSGSFEEALLAGPFDVVLCNPPYVPSESVPSGDGLHRAWDAGVHGRSVLNPLCDHADDLVAAGGSMFVVQSEFAEPEKTVRSLCARGFSADIHASRSIDFGPVMRERAEWLERSGRVRPDCRTETLVVIRADKL
ncbi:methyltransferase [Rhodococcus sp. G-MC3]|nr:HemK2/MTQ2 family protein methyltransferase [Rhodococcus sp. G-MC3]MDJ0392931.1 methyltransferase [Rhodococcus sp. G-MC3]